MTDTLRQSIKTNDRIRLNDSGTAVTVLTPWSWGGADLMPPGLPDALPLDWRTRDRYLRATVAAEGMWGNAVAIAINQVVATDFLLDGGPRLVERGRAILLTPRWSPKLKKAARDWITQNNGYHLEIIRSSSARGSRVLGVDHLDSNRCQRTGDPERPIIYTDRAGAEHVLHWWQVISGVDLESPALEANGMGLCAAERAYHYIREMAIVTTYIIEKTGGRKPLAIYLVNNLNPGTLEAIVATAEADNAQLDRMATAADVDQPPPRVGSYMGAIVGALPTDKKIEMVKIDLAGLPDRFNRQEEWDIGLLAYAKSIGIDVQEIQPLTGRALGTGAQSQVLHEKGKKSGMSAFKQSLKEALEYGVLPAGVTFTWSDYDLLEQLRKAELSKTHTEDLSSLVERQIITPEQALQVKVDLDELPEAFLDGPDTTPDVVVSSADNDDAVEEDADAAED